MSEWHVAACRQYAKATQHNSWRVQRWIQLGHEGAYEMAFVHEDWELCQAVATLLNGWPNNLLRSQADGWPAVIQFCIPSWFPLVD